MAEHFDAVVVGSGFGGSVMAFRLAEGGFSVCLLERGKAYPPGSFPRSPAGFRNNFWDPSEGGHGMFDVWTFRGLEAVVASGLGGGSLIYANVLIRKDEKWFVREDPGREGYEYWPVTRCDLDPHYDRVERMLNAQTYPFQHAPYNATAKTRALQQAAHQLNREWFLPNLAVTFANSGCHPVPGELIREEVPNLHGRQRSTCRLCGECDIGCNYGSKNTLDYNYLTQAQRQGADIRTRCEVRSFAPLPGQGYRVDYVWHDPEREGKRTDTGDLPLRTVTANRLILAAGTVGSVYLLLKNRQQFPGISPTLGTRFCGNGDLLNFAIRCTEPAEGRWVPRRIDPGFGPVITSTLRMPDAADGGQGRGFYLQDAGYPEFVNWLVEASQVRGVVSRAAHFVLRRIKASLTGDPHSDFSGEIRRLLGDAELSSSSMPLLGMGRDWPDGTMRLRRGKKPNEQYLDVDWRNVKSRPYFRRVRETSRQVADALGGTLQQNPATQWFNRLITVHALGGCPMGRNENEGVVNSFGEVFGCPGFYIADGTVMPGPVGANPSLTIAALADRFAEGILAKGKSP
jgi:cholesterol oxidase